MLSSCVLTGSLQHLGALSRLAALCPSLGFAVSGTQLLTSRELSKKAQKGTAPCDVAPATAGISKVGFIGLGAMGTRMAHRLLEKGHPLVVYDTNPATLGRVLHEADKLHPGRVHTAGSAAELAGLDIDVLVTMLPNADIVKQVYLGPSGITQASHITPHVLLDCSTTGPVIAREVAAKVARASLAKNTRHVPGLPHRHPVMVDAPVTGSVTGAEKGSLGFMVGGPDAAVGFVEPLLRAMGASVTRCGDHGDAQAAKLCNTLVTAASMAAVAEALALAKRLGVDPKVMTEVLNAGSGRCWASEEYNPVPGLSPGTPPSQGYKGGLRTDMAAAHLEMAVQAADAAHSPAPLAHVSLELYNKVLKEGMGDLDFSSIYRYVYGSGVLTEEWKAGEKVFDSHAP